VKTIDKIRKYLYMHGDDLRKKFNANGIAAGYKIKGGKYTGTIALVFYVNKKKNTRDLLAEGTLPVPSEVDGIPTDVVARPKEIRPG
jgi:endonuclease G